MKNINKIISTLLAVLMIVGSFSMVISAEESSAPKYEYNTVGVQTLDYYNGKIIEGTTTDDNNKVVYTYVKDENGKDVIVDTAVEKLDTMDLRIEKDGFRLYVDEYSGEVAVECVATGETLFTNPFNVGVSNASQEVKTQLLSQVAVQYSTTTGESGTYYSFKEASLKNQIKVKNIKGGIRVEYAIGSEQTRYLLPEVIEESDYQKLILEPLAKALGEDSFDYGKFDAFYIRMDKADFTGEALTKALKENPLLDKMVYYVLDGKTSERDKVLLEEKVKTYIPDFTYEVLDEVHAKTEHEATEDIKPLFRLALEYTLDEDGVSVRLPANGIRYNESLHTVKSIVILPYMGAASNEGEGYSFFPDGSGAIFDFDRIQELGTTTTITGKVYGQDYAYHTITGTHQEIIRYPVYGMIGSNVITVDENATDADNTEEIVEDGETEEEELVVTMSYTEDDEAASEDTAENVLLIAPAPAAANTTAPVNVERQSGYVAIVTEGDAMMEISSYHELQKHEYNAIQITVYPRPQDSYNLSDSISAGSGGAVPVVSSRRYTGSYKIKYILLTSDEVAREKGITDYYDCSYVGMAYAYRDYLVQNGVLTRLTEEDVKEDIPLYIETFGAMETVEKFLSIPVTVLTPLTTFEDIKTMYDDLSAEGITNVNFKLVGFANGGMVSTVPYNLKWEKSVGGNKGFEELTEYAKEKDFGIYPDFDFVYIQKTGAFDGLSMKKHAVKTIDNRYTSRREYTGTKQTYVSYYEIAISPASFSHFYEKLTDKYTKYDPVGISVSTLGSYLNSDFDKKEPYNREDSKQYTMNAFEYLDENYASVMTSAANSFTWKYVDHITDIALDSSRYAQSAASVPFLGIVLHGYVQIAGEPINLEGNMSYALLKAIESGAGINFLLSYRNTDNLKNDEALSKHYSVRYDIWFDDVVELYTELNAALSDVQTSIIVNHSFIEGVRIPDADELEADAEAEIEAIIKAEADKLEAQKEAERLAIVNARVSIQSAYANLESMKTALDSAMNKLMYDNKGSNHADLIRTNISKYESALRTEQAIAAQLESLKSAQTPDEQAIAAKQAELDAQQAVVYEYGSAINNSYNTVSNATAAINAYDSLANAVAAAREGYEYLAAHNAVSEALLADLYTRLLTVEAEFRRVSGKRNEIFSFTERLYDLVKNHIDVEPYEFVEKSTSGSENTVVETEKTTAAVKYQSDDNMISYVEYENGISFLLNFNNYAVKVELDGTVYTMGEYGYVMFDERN